MDFTIFFLKEGGKQAAVNCPVAFCGATTGSPCLSSLPVPLLLSRLRCPHLLWCGSDGGR